MSSTLTTHQAPGPAMGSLAGAQELDSFFANENAIHGNSNSSNSMANNAINSGNHVGGGPGGQSIQMETVNRGAPPPPSGVDVREFHAQTAGGFGNIPVGKGLSTGIPQVYPNNNINSTNNIFQSLFNHPIGAKLSEFGAGSLSFLLENTKSLESAQEAREKAASYFQGSNLRSWKEFMWPLCKPNDAQEACSFMNRNLSYFQRNYFLLFLIYFLTNIMLSPGSLLLIGLLIVTWALFLRKNEDPSWVVQVGGVVIGPSQRWMCLFTCSGVLVLVICGGMIFSSCICFGIFAIVHSIVHQPPALVDEGGEFGSIPQHLNNV